MVVYGNLVGLPDGRILLETDLLPGEGGYDAGSTPVVRDPVSGRYVPQNLYEARLQEEAEQRERDRIQEERKSQMADIPQVIPTQVVYSNPSSNVAPVYSVPVEAPRTNTNLILNIPVPVVSSSTIDKPFSYDGGQTWTSSTVDPNSVNLNNSITQIHSDFESGTINKPFSYDGGKTWTNDPVGPYKVPVSSINPDKPPTQAEFDYTGRTSYERGFVSMFPDEIKKQNAGELIRKESGINTPSNYEPLSIFKPIIVNPGFANYPSQVGSPAYDEEVKKANQLISDNPVQAIGATLSHYALTAKAIETGIRGKEELFGYTSSGYKDSRDQLSLDIANRMKNKPGAVDLFLESPVTMAIPYGAAFKVGTWGIKGGAALIASKAGSSIVAKGALATGRYIEPAVGVGSLGYMGADIVGSKDPYEAIGKIGIYGISTPGGILGYKGTEVLGSTVRSKLPTYGNLKGVLINIGETPLYEVPNRLSLNPAKEVGEIYKSTSTPTANVNLAGKPLIEGMEPIKLTGSDLPYTKKINNNIEARDSKSPVSLEEEYGGLYLSGYDIQSRSNIIKSGSKDLITLDRLLENFGIKDVTFDSNRAIIKKVVEPDPLKVYVGKTKTELVNVDTPHIIDGKKIKSSYEVENNFADTYVRVPDDKIANLLKTTSGEVRYIKTPEGSFMVVSNPKSLVPSRNLQLTGKSLTESYGKKLRFESDETLRPAKYYDEYHVSHEQLNAMNHDIDIKVDKPIKRNDRVSRKQLSDGLKLEDPTESFTELEGLPNHKQLTSGKSIIELPDGKPFDFVLKSSEYEKKLMSEKKLPSSLNNVPELRIIDQGSESQGIGISKNNKGGSIDISDIMDRKSTGSFKTVKSRSGMVSVLKSEQVQKPVEILDLSKLSEKDVSITGVVTSSNVMSSSSSISLSKPLNQYSLKSMNDNTIGIKSKNTMDSSYKSNTRSMDSSKPLSKLDNSIKSGVKSDIRLGIFSNMSSSVFDPVKSIYAQRSVEKSNINEMFSPSLMPDSVLDTKLKPKLDSGLDSSQKYKPDLVSGLKSIPDQTSKQVPSQIPKQIPGQIPKSDYKFVPIQIPALIPKQIPKQTPKQIPKQVPDTYPVFRPPTKPLIPKVPILKSSDPDSYYKKKKKGRKSIRTGPMKPWYPAAYENVNLDEFQNKGKRAYHVRDQKESVNLFGKYIQGSGSIPTLRQYKKRSS